MRDNPRPVPDFDAEPLGKELLRRIRAGALASLDQQAGFPFASLVTVATDYDGSPLLLLSRLAAHTANLEHEDRASILLAETGRGDPLAHPRLTVMGKLERSAAPAVRDRFLRRHPKAKLYAGFPDFSFWRMTVTGGHLNGGFARAAALSADDLATDLAGAEALIGAEAEALAHLNGDHAGLLALCATGLAGQPEGPWTATGLDPEGLDLMAGERTARIVFRTRVTTPADLPNALKTLRDEAHIGLPTTNVEAAR